MADQRYSRVWGSATVGIDAVSVCIETYLANGLPKHTVVGLPRGAVRESLDRIWAAMRSAGYSVPRGILTVNLAPADVAKEGTAYDLPVAIGIIAADRQEILPDALDKWMILGELTLNGGVRPVRGVLSSAIRARKDGLSRIIVPAGNAVEAASVHGLEVFGVSSIADTLETLKGRHPPVDSVRSGLLQSQTRHFPDLADVVGQASAKFALTVAAAGGHNLLMVGPPGCGKTMLARRVCGILPSLDEEESFETTAIHSLRGHNPRDGLIRFRPFRSPHHSITRAGMTGGGTPIKPGEASLAHNGVLFLDELPEFSRPVLESLREPLEGGEIIISRVSGPVLFPARFLLIAAMNPCPCGNYSVEGEGCTCSSSDRLRYLSRVSGPLRDRIDMTCILSRVSPERTKTSDSKIYSARCRRRVQYAREMQKRRAGLAGLSVKLNSQIPIEERPGLINMTEDALGELDRCVALKRLSMRGRSRLVQVSRTIADLEESEVVDTAHVARAVQYRPRHLH